MVRDVHRLRQSFTESFFARRDRLRPVPAGSLLEYLRQIPDPRFPPRIAPFVRGHAGYRCVRVFTRGTWLSGHRPMDSQSGCLLLARTRLHAPTAALERLSQIADALVPPAVGARHSKLGRTLTG